MLIVGLLFGIALALTLALFGILSMDGHFVENLKAAAIAARDRLTGRSPRATVSMPARGAESETRIRNLQEEIRVQQRLMEQARTEREAVAQESNQARQEIATLREALAERERELGLRDLALQEAGSVATRAREELAAANAELARSRRELKELETELGIARSGAGMSVFSDEVARLTQERDYLRARLEELAAHSSGEQPEVIARTGAAS